MLREELYDKLINREVVLYGIIDEIKEFIVAYQDVLNIKYVITDFQEEVTWQKYKEWGIKTYLFDDLDLGDELIVICSKGKFELLQKRLMHSGKKAYLNYISQELIEVLLYDKKLMVCMGTHLIKQVSAVLKNMPQIAEKYSIIYYSEGEMMKPYINRFPEYLHISRFCDVYVRSSCEKVMFERKIYQESDINSNCQIITIADHGFAGYYPQLDGNRDVLSNYMFREHERLEMSYEILAFSRVDHELEVRCQNKEEKEQIIRRLLDENFYSKGFVNEYFSMELERFKELEVNDDICLGDFISQNYKKRLCRNLDEWNEPIVTYVIEQLLGCLNLKSIKVDKNIVQDVIEEQSGSEIPIYPSVIKYLELYEQTAKKYKVTTYYKTRYMELEEYMEFLVDYICKANELIEYAGMNKWNKNEE